MRGKKARQLRVDRTAEREAARRKQRQQTLFTVVVIVIIVAIGGVLVGVTINQERQVAESPTDLPTDPASEAGEQPDDRPVACGGERPAGADETKQTYSEPEQVLEEGTDYRARITTSCGTVTVDLYEDRAPETVNSFVFLAEQGFFDGLEIFRNATTIGALQTGAGDDQATWDIGYQLDDELEAAQADGYPPGTLAMANSGPDTAGSQFFFVYNDKFQLDPTFAVFGKANPKGVDVLQTIGDIPVQEPDGPPPGGEKPTEITYIESVTITTK